MIFKKTMHFKSLPMQSFAHHQPLLDSAIFLDWAVQSRWLNTISNITGSLILARCMCVHQPPLVTLSCSGSCSEYTCIYFMHLYSIIIQIIIKINTYINGNESTFCLAVARGGGGGGRKKSSTRPHRPIL